jgi:salicylate hydroxylase
MQVTLIGDAAHIMPPHLAQGAGQSFEDIAYLKTQLQEKELSDALRFYGYFAGQSAKIHNQQGQSNRAGYEAFRPASTAS